MSVNPFPNDPGLAIPVIQARTAPAGIALINGTQNFLSWTTPNDGQLHQAIVSATLVVTVSLTGGAIVVRWVSGGQACISTLVTASAPAGDYGGTGSLTITADPGTTVTLAQLNAASAGAAQFYGAISGA